MDFRSLSCWETGFVCSSLPVFHPLGPFQWWFQSLVLGMGKKPTVPEVLALGDYHGKTSKVGNVGLGECSLASGSVFGRLGSE